MTVSLRYERVIIQRGQKYSTADLRVYCYSYVNLTCSQSWASIACLCIEISDIIDIIEIIKLPLSLPSSTSRVIIAAVQSVHTGHGLSGNIQTGPLLLSEKPNLAELHEILNYWQTLLTCMQVQLPEMNEDNRGVIHVSHHGTQVLDIDMSLI